MLRPTLVLFGLLFTCLSHAADVTTSFPDDQTSGSFTLGTPPKTVTFTGGEVRIAGISSLYRSGARAYMVRNETATITFGTPAAELLFYIKRQSSATGTVRLLDENDNELLSASANTSSWTQVHLTHPDGIHKVEFSNSQNGLAAMEDFEYTAVIEAPAPEPSPPAPEAIADPIMAMIEEGAVNVELETLVSGLVSPTFGIPAPNNVDFTFIVDQVGKLFSLNMADYTLAEVMDLADRLVSLNQDFDERGLLGFAFHPDFNTEFIHSRVYKLKELAEFAEPDWSVYQRGEKENPNPDSRHLSLFHKVRHLAYQQVNQYRLGSDLESFYQFVLKECLANNRFQGAGFREDENLPASSVKAVAKSIATWTWNNYTGTGCNRGIMKLPHDMEQKQKQHKAAGYVAALKRERSLERLKLAFKKLLNENVKPTQTKVAHKAELSLSTVKRYWQEIKSSSTSSVAAENSNKKVSLAIHKVSSPRDLKAPALDVGYTFKISSFLLKQYSSALSLNSSLFNQEFLTSTSQYRFQPKSGRLVESSSELFNVQTLPKAIRQSVFKGWYEIDLVFSHGQMLLDVMSTYLEDVLQPAGVEETDMWKMLEIDAWSQSIAHYSDFLNNFDERLTCWEKLSAVSAKKIKVALISYLHGAGRIKLDNLLSGKLSILLRDKLFVKILKIFELCRKCIKNLSVQLNYREAEVFKDYWGQLLVIHDGILVKDFCLAEKISTKIKYQHTFTQIC